MISLWLTRCSWPRAFFSAKSIAAATFSVTLLNTPASLAGVWPLIAKGPAKSLPAKAASAPSRSAAASQKPGTPEYADALPSPARKAAPDLLLTKADLQKASAYTEFARALISEDNADSDKALAAYRRALDADPSYTELAVKIAYELARRNDIAGAIQILKDAIKATPKEPLPLIYLSQLYSKNLRKPDLALKYAEQALSVAPENFSSHLALVDLYVAGGQTKKAEQALERASKLDTLDPKFWVQLGDLYARLYLKEETPPQSPELEKMNALYRKAADLGRTDAAVLAKVGDYFVLSRQVKDAVPFYVSALQQKPGPEDAPLNNLRDKLARAYLVLENREEAIRLFEDIVKESPMRFETFEILGELYEKADNVDKALENYERGLQLNNAEPRSYTRLTSMLLTAKRFDKAIEVMRAARARFPDRPEVALSLALALSQAKQHEEAMAAFEEAFGESKQSHEEMLTPSFYFQYGAAAEMAGKLDKAVELLKKSIQLDPANASEAYNYLGYMWADRGMNLEEAGEMLKKALELDPDNGSFIDSLGWLHFKKGEYEPALKELLRAAEMIRPDSADVLDHVGDTYQALNKPAEALSYWQRALAAEPGDEKIAAKIQAATGKATSPKPVPAP
ncbi:MAG: Tetratricopeptide 2 repeat protein [Chthoniobacteraceae bacterium]|nr:Tetratricopeptide 2 repeat protein [Chthoniobacteraceae bacterium]